MKVEVHIIGTSHGYQFGAGWTVGSVTCSQDDADAFQSFLVSSARAVHATAICEELSREALAAVGSTVSMPEIVAANLGLPHLFCDPNIWERRTLEILDDNYVLYQALSSDTPRPIEAGIQTRISQQWQKREAEWYRRIIDAGNTPILFICGSDHVVSFSTLLQSKGAQVSVVCQDWAG
jgi:hypothetical protein